MYVFIISNNIRARDIKSENVHIYKFNIINTIDEVIIKKMIILNKEINYYSSSRRNRYYDIKNDSEYSIII